jgi:DNA-binding XRE family transcriptional regulator
MRRPRHQNVNRLWIARKKVGLGQKSVARLLGHKSTSPISEYETGRLIPNLRTALKLAVIYQTPLPDLYITMQRQIEEEVAARRKKLPMTHFAVPESTPHA